jgi:hypothetical protein
MAWRHSDGISYQMKASINPCYSRYCLIPFAFPIEVCWCLHCGAVFVAVFLGLVVRASRSSLSFSTFGRASLCSLVPLQFTQFSPFVARSRICTSWDYANMHVYLMCGIPFCYRDISQAEFMYLFLSLLFHFGRGSIWYLLWPTGILAGDICFSNRSMNMVVVISLFCGIQIVF